MITVAPKRTPYIKITLWVIGVLFIPVVMTIAVNTPHRSFSAPNEQEERDSRSVGRLPPGKCMSGPMATKAAIELADRIDWTKVEGAATFGLDLKLTITQFKVFAEMKRLGTQPCPDLRPLYERWSAAAP